MINGDYGKTWKERVWSMRPTHINCRNCWHSSRCHRWSETSKGYYATVCIAQSNPLNNFRATTYCHRSSLKASSLIATRKSTIDNRISSKPKLISPVSISMIYRRRHRYIAICHRNIAKHCHSLKEATRESTLSSCARSSIDAWISTIMSDTCRSMPNWRWRCDSWSGARSGRVSRWTGGGATFSLRRPAARWVTASSARRFAYPLWTWGLIWSLRGLMERIRRVRVLMGGIGGWGG